MAEQATGAVTADRVGGTVQAFEGGMNQILRDHLPAIICGVLAGIALLRVPSQSKQAKRIAVTICLLTLMYPIAILLLYLRRGHLGESYAYIVYGLLVCFALGIIAAVLFVAWLVAFKRGRNETRNSN